ncbi:ring finger protein [Ophiostoma piceae UAMH 11346]|uniref:RING-type E3 ubiquitin transferase n=1 Tax=Ophiostoma piceae (strain UAMH 11346) TaxID=1262450 RepID=S3CBU2_OPHP1|nr:ring finger protein [Ophiostoma piceae UAMH 11346]
MFTQSLPAPAPAPSSSGIHVSSSTSPASPTSRSRLRGLSYLRNYTQSHILNREHSSTSAASTSPTATSSPSANNSTRQATQLDADNTTYPLRQTQSAAAASSFHSPTSAPNTSLALAPVLSHPSATTTSSQSLLTTDNSTPSRSRSPRHTTGLSPPASASLAVSPLQAYGLDSQSTPPLSSTPTHSTSLLQTTSSTAPSLAVNALAATAAIITTGITTAATATSSAASATPATASMTRSRSATEPGASSVGAVENLPSIRFSTFYDPRATRPSLKFSPMSRTLPTGKEVIRVGRYSERDSQPSAKLNEPSASHVGFKSKVVSRRHCEFWYENNRWYIKDVKSSSGTFLNHIRLSQPGTESKPYAVNDGDIVQLGIDFKGGEEMIFRCVKMRIELNRGWQNKLNAFNVNTHKRLRNMTKPTDTDASGQSSQDCSICLNSIAPCQSLFVAPCSHTWHYKCIRALLDSPQYPSFICPNCRAAVDLEADVEDPPEEWDDMEVEESPVGATEEPSPSQINASITETNLAAIESSGVHSDAPAPAPPPAVGGSSNSIPEEVDLEREPDFGEETAFIDSVMEDADRPPVPPIPEQHQSDSPQDRSDDDAEPVVSHATVNPVSIPSPSRTAAGITSRAGINGATLPIGAGASADGGAAIRQARTPSPSDHLAAPQAEGPITPRNDHGPWVFDGSGIRITSGRASTDSHHGEMRSLDMATAELASQSNN